MADKKLSEQLGAAIFEAGKELVGKKLSKAQFDKSYKTTIVGCNRYFTDDVPAETQAELIKKYNIPEVSESGVYYTFRINGNWYVKVSNNDFKLYEEVVVRVPNGNWDNMFIEVQRDTVGEGGGTGVLSAVKVDGNKLFYNGGEYRLQFGNNKRIMCVTKGKLHHIVETEDVHGSYIEAATAVLNGLTNDCDIEFDANIFYPNDTYDISRLFNSSADLTGVTIDWGDGIITTYPEKKHCYGVKGMFRIKVSGLPESVSYMNFGGITNFWNGYYAGDCTIGSHAYIGGVIETVNNYSAYVTQLTWGERVKEVRDIRSSGERIDGEFVEISIPPCVNVIGSYGYGGQSNYVYIPPECNSIENMAFYNVPLKDIDISPDGEELTLGNYAFNQIANIFDGSYSCVTSLKIPARVRLGQYSFYNMGTRIVKIERGTTEILQYSLNGINIKKIFGDTICPINNNELYIFIPSTVTSIGDNVISYGSTRVIIVYEGSSGDWNKISKSSNWDGDNKNVKFIYGVENYDSYPFCEKEIKKFHEFKSADDGGYVAGSGISIYDSTISVNPGNGLSTDMHGKINVVAGDGIRCDNYNFGKVSVNVGDGIEIVVEEGATSVTEVNGKVTLKKATNNSLGGVKIGEGITVTEDGTISAEGKDFIAGDGIEIADSTISVKPATSNTIGGIKAGKGLKVSSDGTLDVDGGGGSYTAGNGIEINEENAINLKQATDTTLGGIILGEGLEYDSATGKTNTVPNIQQAVIIQEANAKYLLHEYTTVDYIAGNKIVYAGAGNQIIVDGMVVFKNGGIAPNGIKLPSGNVENYSLKSMSEFSTKVPNPPFYSSISLPKNGKWYRSNKYYVNKFELLLNEARENADIYYGYSYEPDGTRHEEYSFMNYYGFEGYGHFYLWNNIYPPGSTVAGETWEFGCVCCTGYKLYRDSNYNDGTIHITILNTALNAWYFPFVSEAEYNAAVGLTYEPNTLTQVNETITEV